MCLLGLLNLVEIVNLISRLPSTSTDRGNLYNGKLGGIIEFSSTL